MSDMQGLVSIQDHLIDHAEQKKLLLAWNATEHHYPGDACVPHLVARQAAATPDAVALVAGTQVISYRQLNQRSNQLAHYLQTLGIGPNVLVGCCVDRSIDMVVALLAILKAGGAYMPLDPAYPAERLSFMLRDAHTPVLLTQKRLAERLAGPQVIFVDADKDKVAQQSENDPVCLVSGTDLAYVVYTSGSTGQPKGVEITHNSLLNLIFWHQRVFVVGSSDRATQVTSPAFDATGWELWPYLTIGASIYLPDEDTRVNPALLRDWLNEHHITITFLPTALAESIMVLEWPATSSLRLLLTGADRLNIYPSPSLPFTLVNNYGPSETTVVATSGYVPTTPANGEPPSIGRPIDNTQIYILDEQLQPVPLGMPGELYIGGVGLARGYLKRPELTTERFIPDPFGVNKHARLYKTGDLARFLADGQIAFLGRSDQQIKIRGYRIEPGEIVSVLNKHPSIHTSLVVAREDTPGDKRLVAYIVLAPEAHTTAGDLRTTLKTYLPDYMIPAAFVVLESLPLTPNGKLDRDALPAPDALNTLQDGSVAVPTTPLQRQLIEIVTRLLKVERVGLDDNFFMLGGHSLLGTQVIANVAELFSVDISLRALFKSPTVRLLAAEVEKLIIARLDTMSEEDALRLLQ